MSKHYETFYYDTAADALRRHISFSLREFFIPLNFWFLYAKKARNCRLKTQIGNAFLLEDRTKIKPCNSTYLKTMATTLDENFSLSKNLSFQHVGVHVNRCTKTFSDIANRKVAAILPCRSEMPTFRLERSQTP